MIRRFLIEYGTFLIFCVFPLLYATYVVRHSGGGAKPRSIVITIK